MMNHTLAWRIEWNGRGPFWDERILRQLVRKARQVTPEWKAEDLSCSTFLEHYMASADCPYDHPLFDHHLSRQKEGSTDLGFGFLDEETLASSFGLENPLYRRQFDGLLERNTEFVLKAYLVQPLAISKTEVLFPWKGAELVDEIKALSFSFS